MEQETDKKEAGIGQPMGTFEIRDVPEASPGAKDRPFPRHCYKCYGPNDSTCQKPYGHEDECGPLKTADVPKVKQSGTEPAAISFGEGKKIYDQGWNDGIEYLKKVLLLLVEQRFRNQ